MHCVSTCLVELCGSLEESWQCCLQDHDEVLQLLSYSNKQVLIYQVVFGLFQGPSTARIPAHKVANTDHKTLLVYVRSIQRRFPLCFCFFLWDT